MKSRFIIKVIGGGSAVAALAVAGVSPALAARKHSTRSHTRHAQASQTTNGSGETPLTGATLTSASNAATAANPGATVDGASTENDSSLTGAAYEVHITKADGSHAKVIEDSSFTVLATNAENGGPGHGPGGRDGAPGGPGGPGGPGSGETPLTGATLTSASNAATAANPGATVDGASTENDSSLTGAAYEVHITKADGSHAKVIEDSSFTVLATNAENGGPGHGPRG